MSTIKKGFQKIEADSYTVGKQLLPFKDPERFRGLGYTSFRALVEGELKGRAATAYRYTGIAANFTKRVALQLGTEKAHQIIQLAEADKTLGNPADIVKLGKKIGDKKIAEMKAVEIKAAVRAIRLNLAGKEAAPPKMTDVQKRDARRVRGFFKRKAPHSRVRLDLRHEQYVIRVPILEMVAVVGPRRE